ncbi:SMP-30/gluconolactonase/LRE family protein [Pararcticibacter amylolyticus]|uniref:Gluconolactonase n=1 Tax=Pararcticibacter amylolyticus TaxID=2173175 RepID=A0A2U2PG23_9SPHI|nr:SMP-30/gluconolactonase/LRE family protein [Pararcticibacter amylolyticus]PWG80357.1 gluconolactonase [Pararcticibacter amylolyticus]
MQIDWSGTGGSRNSKNIQVLKKLALSVCLSVVLLSCGSVKKQKQTDQSFPVANGAELELISNSFSFTEGPASDKDGNVFFTDQPNNKIWKYDISGKLTLFKENAGRANGMYFAPGGKLIACADEHNQLWALSPDGHVKVLVDQYQNRKLNGPNDVWVNKKGVMYFTDPYYQRSYWTRKSPELAHQGVYILRKGELPQSIDDSLKRPNGIVGTPDGKYLYVADIEAGKTYRYTLAADGSVRDKKLLIEQGSDGMTLDNFGNIYLSGNGVTVYNSSGIRIKHIPVPSKWTANVCFGGRNKDWLFITATESLYKIKMQVRGVSE